MKIYKIQYVKFIKEDDKSEYKLNSTGYLSVDCKTLDDARSQCLNNMENILIKVRNHRSVDGFSEGTFDFKLAISEGTHGRKEFYHYSISEFNTKI